MTNPERKVRSEPEEGPVGARNPEAKLSGTESPLDRLKNLPADEWPEPDAQG